MLDKSFLSFRFCTLRGSRLIWGFVWGKGPIMVAASRDSKDVTRVVKALANGLRSATNIGDTAKLPADRVRVTLDWLAAKDHVTRSSVMGETLWRLSDDGQDMLKAINAAYRKGRVRILGRIEGDANEEARSAAKRKPQRHATRGNPLD